MAQVSWLINCAAGTEAQFWGLQSPPWRPLAPRLQPALPSGCPPLLCRSLSKAQGWGAHIQEREPPCGTSPRRGESCHGPCLTLGGSPPAPPQPSSSAWASNSGLSCHTRFHMGFSSAHGDPGPWGVGRCQQRYFSRDQITGFCRTRHHRDFRAGRSLSGHPGRPLQFA